MIATKKPSRGRLASRGIGLAKHSNLAFPPPDARRRQAAVAKHHRSRPQAPPSRGQGPGALVGVHGLAPSQAAPQRSGVKGGPRRPPPFRRNCAGSRRPPLRRGAQEQPGARRARKQKERRRRQHHRRRRRSAARVRHSRKNQSICMKPKTNHAIRLAAPSWTASLLSCNLMGVSRTQGRLPGYGRDSGAGRERGPSPLVKRCLCPGHSGHMRLSRSGSATPRRQHATSAFHVPASDTFVRSISLRFDAFAKQCKRLPSFGALDFLPAEGILHSSATPDAAHVPWGRETSPAEGPGRGPCPLADPTYPRTSKEMSPCSSVSALSTIRRSVSIFSDVEHPGLYQMPPPTSKP